MNKLRLADLPASELAGKRVLVRVDFNVPLEHGRITDDTRVRAALPTIERLRAAGARTILVSHLGRPKGVSPEFSLAPVARRLSELLGAEVPLAADVVGPDAEARRAALRDGQVLLLENVRFHPEEEKNDPAFAERLAAGADLYVNDAFGTAHRAHASTEGVAHHLKAVAGDLLFKEIDVMGRALEHPARPLVAIVGGSKVSSKIGVLEHLLKRVDALVVGGAMAFTFFKAEGLETGRSLVEPDQLDLARRLMTMAQEMKVELLLPKDVVVAAAIDAAAAEATVPVTGVPADLMGVDVGPETRAAIAAVVAKAKTVIWNGPLGVFENPAFAAGTLAVAQAMAEATKRGATTIVGGGDSVAAVEQAGLADAMSHVSTGGGASLEFMEGKVLPGVAALADK